MERKKRKKEYFKATDELIEQHSPHMRDVALRRKNWEMVAQIEPPTDAIDLYETEDVTIPPNEVATFENEAWIKVLDKLQEGAYDPQKGSFGGWSSIVATRHWISKWRREKLRRKTHDVLPDDEMCSGLSVGPPPTSMEIEDRQMEIKNLYEEKMQDPEYRPSKRGSLTRLYNAWAFSCRDVNGDDNSTRHERG